MVKHHSRIINLLSLFLISPLISLFYQESELTLLLRITAFTFIVTPFSQQFQTLLQKEFFFRSLAIINITTSTFSTLLTIGLAIYGFGVFSLVVGYVIDFSMRTVLTIFAGRRVWKPAFIFDRRGLKKFLTFGLYQLGDRTLNYFNINIDLLVIGKILGATALGYYSIAYNLILYPISAINPIFTSVSFPYFSKFQDNTELLKERYFDLIKNVSFLFIPLYTLVIPIAPVLIPLLYGPQWNTSILIVQLLAVLGFYRGLANPIGSLMYAKGYVRRSFLWNIMVVIIIGVGVDVGAIYNGIAGVASIKSLMAIVLLYLSYLFLIKKCIGPCFVGYVKNFLPFLIFGAIGAVTASFINFSSSILQLLMQVIVGGGIYLLFVILFYKAFLKQFIGRYLMRQKIINENSKTRNE